MNFSVLCVRSVCRINQHSSSVLLSRLTEPDGQYRVNHASQVPNTHWADSIVFTIMPKLFTMRGFVGGIAQLGERLHGMQEVSGSIPLTSTN